MLTGDRRPKAARTKVSRVINRKGFRMKDDQEPSISNDKPAIVAFFGTLKPTGKVLTLVGLVLLILSAFAVLAYLCWIVWLPDLWGWGFAEHDWKVLRAAAAVFGAMYLILIPLFPFTYGPKVLGPLLAFYVRDRSLQKAEEASEEQIELEQKLIQDDTTGLIELVKNSRLQLQEYYYKGHSQAEKSFRYSILAMWIGFGVIITGVAAYIFQIFGTSSSSSTDDVHILTVASGAVIEIVSALFLWVYSRSIRQLTYFYDRQSYNHHIIMCTKIAEKADKSDDIRKLIVERVLEHSWAFSEEESTEVGRIAANKTNAADR